MSKFLFNKRDYEGALEILNVLLNNDLKNYLFLNTKNIYNQFIYGVEDILNKKKLKQLKSSRLKGYDEIIYLLNEFPNLDKNGTLSFSYFQRGSMYYIESLNDNIHKNSKNIDMAIRDISNKKYDMDGETIMTILNKSHF